MRMGGHNTQDSRSLEKSQNQKEDFYVSYTENGERRGRKSRAVKYRPSLQRANSHEGKKGWREHFDFPTGAGQP